MPNIDDDWKVTIPRGEVVVFRRDTGVCKGMPYIDLREHAEGHIMLETVQKNMEMFTKKEIERVELARAVQRRIGHSTDEHMKNIASQQSLKNILISISDTANAKILFEPFCRRTKGVDNTQKGQVVPDRQGANTR